MEGDCLVVHIDVGGGGVGGWGGGGWGGGGWGGGGWGGGGGGGGGTFCGIFPMQANDVSVPNSHVPMRNFECGLILL